MSTNVVVFYSCRHCGLERAACPVQARAVDEDIVAWIGTVGAALSADHRRRSPRCNPKTFSDVAIPITGADRIGGPAVN